MNYIVLYKGCAKPALNTLLIIFLALTNKSNTPTKYTSEKTKS